MNDNKYLISHTTYQIVDQNNKKFQSEELEVFLKFKIYCILVI